MDDFECGHDPASKPLNKNHIPSVDDRYAPYSATSITSKSSNSERIRFTRHFSVSRRRAQNGILQPQLASIATSARACDGETIADEIAHGDEDTHLSATQTFDRPRCTRQDRRQSSLRHEPRTSACRHLTCWQVESREHSFSTKWSVRQTHAPRAPDHRRIQMWKRMQHGTSTKGGRASTTLARKPHTFHRNNHSSGATCRGHGERCGRL
jgi:hypothetical protein